ncbi:MAG: ATP-binding protein [Bacteroidota bacterium]
MGVSLQLGQVFQNLISNSLKFSDGKKDPEIMITSSEIEKGGVRFNRIKFTDNGIGFDNAYAEKIFEIFQRLHTKDRFEGTGVGLAIVKKIIAMHGGEIRGHSDGNGATFEILLPIA